MKSLEITDSSQPVILIVDDQMDHIQKTGSLLSRAGYKVAAVFDEDNAVKSAESYNPDIILLDEKMGKESDSRLYRQFAEHDKLKHTPLLLFTGSENTEQANPGTGPVYLSRKEDDKNILKQIRAQVSYKRSRERLRTQTEDLKHSEETRNKIYRMLNHDLRGPLNAMQGLLEILINDVENDEFEKETLSTHLKYVSESSTKISNLLKNLLDWTRVQSEDLTLDVKAFSVMDQIQGVIESMQVMAENRDIEMNFEWNEELIIEADQRMLSTVLRNLLSNAIKFSKRKGCITINAEKADGECMISVQDQGSGMTREMINSILHESGCNHESGENNKEVAGLGLMLCNYLVKIMGGSIDVKSEPGEGSLFKVYLPVAQELLVRHAS